MYYGVRAVRKYRTVAYWCDKEKLQEISRRDPASIRRSLTRFHNTNPEVYQRALDLLPDNFEHRRHLCGNINCVFSIKTPGTRSITFRPNGLCHFCDPGCLVKALDSCHDRKFINKAIGRWARSEQTDIVNRVMQVLPDGYLYTTKLCVAPGCVFNTSQPGTQAV